MNFNSLAFLIFLHIAVGFHWLLPHRARKYWLLAASWFFYMYWNPLFIFLLLFSTAVDYFCGRGMAHWREQKRIKRLLLSVSMVMNLGLLFFFKYWDFFGGIMNGVWAALGLSFRTPELNLILPVGISFYTFQTMSYTIDVYRGKFEAEKDFVTFALYVSFFPQLVAGPIERADNLLGQLWKERRFDRDDLTAGLRLLVSGYFRKIVVADLAAPFVNAVFAAEAPDGSAVLAAVLLFGIQIYGDFSGYSEIAMGSARLLGVRLMRNFDRPYGAANIREFWRRWHISLTRWFTDYVYIPLGGSKKGLARQLFATTVVFALCGLWHGAAWSYVLWGLLHACFLNLYTLRKRRFPALPSGLWEHALTYGAVTFSWLFFRAGDTGRAILLTGRFFSAWDVASGVQLLMSAGLRGASPVLLLLLLAGGLLMLRRLPVLTTEEKPPVPVAAWAGLLLAILIAALIRIDSGTASAFIYFQF